MSANGSAEEKLNSTQLLEQDLESYKQANAKLTTRLQGYETVAKLAIDRESENKELTKHVLELNRVIEDLKINNSKRQPPSSTARIIAMETKNQLSYGQAHDLTSGKGLTDLSCVVSTKSPTMTSSDSFSIIGKNSRDANTTHNTHFSYCESRKGNVQVEHSPSSLNIELSESTFAEGGKAVNEKLTTAQTGSEAGKDSRQSAVLSKDEYIQVFPHTTQSGDSAVYMPSSLDREMPGGQSYVNSSRQGPVSILAVSNDSIPSYEFVKVNKKDDKNETLNREPETTGSKNVGPYSGTGARPKGTQIPSVTERAEAVHGVQTSSNPPNSKDALMVRIPTENCDPYRINNTPMLPYGREESQTEISALTSFGSSLPSFSPDKAVEGAVQYDNLNLTQPNFMTPSTSTSLKPTVPKLASLGNENPLSQPIFLPKLNPEHVKDFNLKLLKEIESQRKKITELHLANKEWKDHWDVLKKQTETENQQLQAKLKEITHESERYKRELENVIASQKGELSQLNLLKREAEKTCAVLISGQTQEKQLLEKLKQDYGTLHQEKRSLEVQLEAAMKTKLMLLPADCQKQSSELETELSVVKRQVTLFMDDFNKEHQERCSVENKLQKEKEANQNLETKLKRTHALLKGRDEDLRKKTMQVSDLNYQIEELKLKLEVEQRRASIYPSMDLSVSPHVHNGNDPFFPEAILGTSKIVTVPKLLTWNCPACTFANKLSHKRCEICETPCTGTESRYVELDS